RPLEPDPGEALDPRRLEPERRERADQRFLQVAAVALHVGAVPRQVEDGVADELAGGVVGRLSAAVGLDDVDLGAGWDVQLALLGAAAERHDGRVLEEHDRLRHCALPDGGGERALEIPRLLVRRDAQIHEVGTRAHGHRVYVRRPSRSTVQRSTLAVVSNPFAIHGSSASLEWIASSLSADTISRTRRPPGSGPP